MNWKNIKDRKPHAYQTGCWDGKKSDEVLVCTRSGLFHVAVMYHVIMDGSESFDFYDSRDFDIQNVEYWTEIDRPL
jgi:hypothetical protein